jgi:2-polyprenyl-3-methyl-5-hydroxy-6-metoxy-1,4-benzoquinol methylase
METTDPDYAQFLENKYRPGREFYLRHLIYPKYLRAFKPGMVYDIGCGFGAFLAFMRARGLPVKGFDSNPGLVELCARKGFEVTLENITCPARRYPPAPNLICDNVLEHLSEEEIDSFFRHLDHFCEPGGNLLVIVPNRKGYASDPTHKTFVELDLIQAMARKHALHLDQYYLHPIPRAECGARYIFNMSVFVLQNKLSAP